MKNKLKIFDDFFMELINRRMRNKYFDYLMYRLTNLGGALFSSLVIFLMIVFGDNKLQKTGVEIFVVLFFSQLLVHTLKRLLSRERPYKILEHLNTFGIQLKDYSFPSGHTAASFSIATTIALNIPRLSILVFVLAIIVGFSRVYLGVHYPTDVAAGFFIGFLTSLIIHYFFIEIVYGLGKLIGIN